MRARMSGSVRGVVEKSPRLLDGVARLELRANRRRVPIGCVCLVITADRVCRWFFPIWGGITLCPAAT